MFTNTKNGISLEMMNAEVDKECFINSNTLQSPNKSTGKGNIHNMEKSFIECGRSGAQLSLTSDGKYVLKSGSSRLFLQADKQESLRNKVKCTELTIPSMTPVTEGVMMDFIAGFPLPIFLSECGSASVASTAIRIKKFMNDVLEQSVQTIWSRELHTKLEEKIFSIQFSLKESPVELLAAVKTSCDMALSISHRFIGLSVPLGVCHGDLTLTNIIADTSGQLYGVDVLDTFLETPLQDFAALFQDVSLYWYELVMQVPDVAKVRTRLTMQHIRGVIVSQFRQESWWPFVEAFLLLKISRIAPYVYHNSKETDWVINSLKNISNIWDHPSTGIPLAVNHALTTLLVPACGASTRFMSTGKPKWLLTQPSGRIMLEESIEKLPLKSFQKIVIALSAEDIDTHLDGNTRKLCLEISRTLDLTSDTFQIIVIPRPRPSDQLETVQQTVQMLKLTGPLFVKDVDNTFAMKSPPASNTMGLCVVSCNDLVDIKGKSRAHIGTCNRVLNVTEKNPAAAGAHVIVGGYAFPEASLLLQFPIYPSHLTKGLERRISDVIFWLMMEGIACNSYIVSNYEDWGSAETWKQFCARHATIFIDLDGTLVKNRGGRFFKDSDEVRGFAPPLIRNVDEIKYRASLGATIIVTTSRSERERDVTERELSRLELRYSKLIMDLPHSRRILVNDYAPTNPFPSAIAINLERNSEKLDVLFHETAE